jgi:hypothetical protein
VTPGLCVLGLAAVLLFAGTRLPGLTAPGDGALTRTVFGAMAGMVFFHLLVVVLGLVELRWSLASLGVGLALPIGLAFRFRPLPDEERRRWPSDLGWGDETALFAVVLFAALALTLWVTTSDFFYHWGLKGERFFLARQVDYGFLARGWGWSIHPDYPNLLPELHAASAILAGRFNASAQMLWSVLFFLLLLAAAREALRQQEPWVRQAGVALLAVSTAAFAFRAQTAGGADWMPALALLAAVPALARRPDRAGDLQVGIAAAFAAASKVEGVMLGALLIAVQLVRRPEAGSRLGWPRLVRLVAPAAAVVIPWWIEVQRHHLFTVLTSGGLTRERTQTALPAMLDALNIPGWHGFAYVLFLLPLLAFRRPARPLAFVAGGQLLFYVWIYLVAAFDTRFYVLNSFPRLLFHLVPAVLVGLIAALPSHRLMVSTQPLPE